MKNLQLPLLLLLAITFFSACSKSSDSNPKPPVAPHTPPLIVILGSSSAAGEGANPIDSAWAYRIQGVVAQHGSDAKFIDLAVAGYTTYQAMPTGTVVPNRPAPDANANITKALSLKPSLVILSFPSNDIAANYTGNETLHNFQTMTHMLDSAKVQYIVFGTQPRDFPTTNQRYREKTFNDTLVNVYSTHANNFYAPLSTSNYEINPAYSDGDGIHLNNSGQALIMNATLKQPIFMQVVQMK